MPVGRGNRVSAWEHNGKRANNNGERAQSGVTGAWSDVAHLSHAADHAAQPRIHAHTAQHASSWRSYKVLPRRRLNPQAGKTT